MQERATESIFVERERKGGAGRERVKKMKVTTFHTDETEIFARHLENLPTCDFYHRRTLFHMLPVPGHSVSTTLPEVFAWPPDSSE